MDDFERIRRLVALYAQLLDSGRLAEWGGLFTADASFTLFGRILRGREEIVREIGAMQPGPDRPVKHLLLPPVIDLGPDGQALVWTDVTVFATGPDRAVSIATIGRYHDRLVREGSRWRFRERVLLFAGEPVPEGVAPVPAA
jgi:3-phenylpropionate/cinnamic acid dioxygenase small subunit